MFFLNKRSNFEKKPHELSYRSNNLFIEESVTKALFFPVLMIKKTHFCYLLHGEKYIVNRNILISADNVFAI